MIKRISFMALVLFLSAGLSFAASPASRRQKPKTGLAGLMARISAYMSSDPVLKARVTAVAAVRGGIPSDQGEDLDQRLMDRASYLRGRLLFGPDARDEAALRRVYQALSVSLLVQAVELPLEADMRSEARSALQAWSGLKHAPSLPASLKEYLADIPEKPDDKALVAAGWARYCREITPELKPARSWESQDRVPQSDTAKLDEALGGLRKTWMEKAVTPEDSARARFLAGFTYSELARADFKGSASLAGSVAAPRTEAAPSGETAPKASPRKVAAPAVEDGPEEAPFNPRFVYSRAAGSVVLILCTSEDGQGELGSGSVIDGSGRVLTNAHVVIRDSTRKPWPNIRVYLKPAKMTGDNSKDLISPVEAEVAASDGALDLALLKLETPPSGVTPLVLADPEAVEIGDKVAAIGHPEQGGLWTLTTGVVSSLVADIGNVKGKNVFQTDASINRGNSGGPLLNAAGDIVGVNTLMSRKASDGLAITSVNFAVRSDVAKRWLASAGTRVAYAPPARTGVAAAAQIRVPASVPQVRVIQASAGTSSRKQAKEVVSESKPFSQEDVIAQAIKEMEALEGEMHEEVNKRRRQSIP